MTISEASPRNKIQKQPCASLSPVLENDYILAALKELSYFTYKVTMPYLNCVERVQPE